MPILRRAARSALVSRPVISWSDTRIVPLVGLTSPFRQRTSVLFPAPDRR